jgi:hypothetical protein
MLPTPQRCPPPGLQRDAARHGRAATWRLAIASCAGGQAQRRRSGWQDVEHLADLGVRAVQVGADTDLSE